MANIKSMQRISSKWNDRASQSQQQYTDGVQNPRADWMTATAAAEANFEKAMQAAISRKSFGKGVKLAGTPTWQANALAKGPLRWAEGVRLAVSKFERAFQPYREVIERTVLPPRGPRGDPGNIQRVAMMAKALHDEKVKRMGA